MTNVAMKTIDSALRAELLYRATESSGLAGPDGLAHRIRLARKLRGLTQGDIAKACGITRPAVGFWERPETCSPSARQVLILSDLLQVSLDWLLRGRQTSSYAAAGSVSPRLATRQPKVRP